MSRNPYYQGGRTNGGEIYVSGVIEGLDHEQGTVTVRYWHGPGEEAAQNRCEIGPDKLVERDGSSPQVEIDRSGTLLLIPEHGTVAPVQFILDQASQQPTERIQYIQ